jgi:hypothetical protein
VVFNVCVGNPHKSIKHNLARDYFVKIVAMFFEIRIFKVKCDFFSGRRK